MQTRMLKLNILEHKYTYIEGPNEKCVYHRPHPGIPYLKYQVGNRYSLTIEVSNYQIKSIKTVLSNELLLIHFDDKLYIFITEVNEKNKRPMIKYEPIQIQQYTKDVTLYRETLMKIDPNLAIHLLSSNDIIRKSAERLL